MNFCTKCQSIYSQPGTCNCYAPAKPIEVQPLPYVPYVPTPVPWSPPPFQGPFWWYSPTITTLEWKPNATTMLNDGMQVSYTEGGKVQ